ncbi:transaldolase [Aquihabitans sp. G128]|uniref:transaldolase n=1 Tax=Aquihabitans sp. G128 TaxID=2849779 RepID=UPI001C2203C4|nr:transaldolase [Aquihabitans sp. G128]QXC62058.1 transaldolase [Aquihabitans sp. G128]
MTKLQDLHDEGGQSPWLDNLRRDWIHEGELARWIERGVRGVTSNPSIFQKAMTGQAVYDDQFRSLLADGASVEDCFWSMAVTDIEDALALFRPVHDASDGVDGYVSIEVAPSLARDTEGTTASALDLHARIDEPNLYVKIPGTAEGLPAIQAVIGAGKSVNVTLLFSLSRYEAVIEAYLAGLEAFDGDLAPVSSVASFFVSRVDAEVDKRLVAIGTPEALALKGKAAVANAQLAYELFLEKFSGPRWEALAAKGAKVQRPLWASTSTKDPSYPPTLYVDTLIAPDTVNTMPEATLDAFDEQGTVARTADADLGAARQVLADLAGVGVDLDDVTDQLEEEGVASFTKAFDELIASLGEKAADLRGEA